MPRFLILAFAGMMALVAIALIAVIAGQTLLSKLIFYMNREGFGVSDFAKLIIVVVGCRLTLRQSMPMFTYILVLLPAIAVIGGSRIFVVIFTALVYFIIVQRCTRKTLVLALMGFYCYKTVGYLTLMAATGNGYPDG